MGPLGPNCFIESLRSWMQRRCKDPIDPNIEYLPCCESSKFPYKPDVLEQCAAEVSTEIARTPYLWIRNTAGLKFLKEQELSSITPNNTLSLKATPKIKALIVEYDSIYTYTLSFTTMNKFFHEVSNTIY